MVTNKEHESKVSGLNSRIQSLQMCMSRVPDHVRRTGKIKGEDSRYTLQVWTRPYSGNHYAVLIHHHPRQSDMVIQDGMLSDMEQSHRIQCCRSEESRAIYELFIGALREVGEGLRSMVEV